jgi:hypothetical protein
MPSLPARNAMLQARPAGVVVAVAFALFLLAPPAHASSAARVDIQSQVSAATAACVPGDSTLCLGDGGRFKAEVVWSSQTSGGGNAVAVSLASAPQSGLFYFLDPSNIEMLVKVLNACIPALGNHYWVFFAATTNVQFTLTVTDTQTGQMKMYSNPLNQAALPVQDTNAFATCP